MRLLEQGLDQEIRQRAVLDYLPLDGVGRGLPSRLSAVAALYPPPSVYQLILLEADFTTREAQNRCSRIRKYSGGRPQPIPQCAIGSAVYILLTFQASSGSVPRSSTARYGASQ